MSDQSDQPIIIIKKIKKVHGGHHGGAWKVAYADFVTAMMAFFLVMWLVSQSEQVKAGIGGYFRDPGMSEFEGGTSDVPGFPGESAEESDLLSLEQTANRIRRSLAELPELARLTEQIEVEMSTDGLRIELLESSRTSFFDTGSTTLKGDSIRLLGVIAEELGQLDNDVILEGHTDSRPFSGADSYTNWELSTERANAARRVMVQSGLRPAQIKSVRGHADTVPRIESDPFDPRNRRVSIIVKGLYTEAEDLPVAPPHEEPEAEVESSPEPAAGH